MKRVLAVAIITAFTTLAATVVHSAGPEVRADFNTAPTSVQRYTGAEGYGIGAPVCFLRDIAGNTIPPTTVQHAMDGTLGPMLMTHTVTDKRDLSFTAVQHAMTTPYGVGGFQICDNPIGSFVYDGLTPMTFSVDISTAGVAARKWPVIWLIQDGTLRTPLPSDPGFIDTVRDHPNEVSVPNSAIFIKPERFNDEVTWSAFTTWNGKHGCWWCPIPVTEDYAIRTPHKVVIQGNTLSLYINGQWMWSEDIVPSSWINKKIEVRLDFTDYNSEKDGDPNTTWHWDNVLLQGNNVKPATSGTSPTSTATSSPTSVATASSTPTPLATPTATSTVVPTTSPTATATATPSSTPTPSPTPLFCEVYSRLNGLEGWKQVDCGILH